jgi:hypothetical protein
MSQFPLTARRQRAPQASSSPRPAEAARRSPAQIALGGAGDIASHNRLANLQLIERAMDEAARLNALRQLFEALPEDAQGYPLRQDRDAQCKEWQSMVETMIKTAVLLTLETQGLGRDPETRMFVERDIRRQIAEAPPPEELREQLSLFRRYNAAVVAGTLQFIREQSPASARTPTWHGLIGSPGTDEDLAQRIDELVQAGIAFRKDDLNDMLGSNRFDLIEQVVARNLLHPATTIRDGDEELSLLAFGIKHELGDGYLKVLLEKGADVNVKVGSGRTMKSIVSLAIGRDWDAATCEKLVLDGAPIPQMIGNEPPLKIVYGRRQLRFFQTLLTAGASTDFTIDGKTLLGKILSENKVLARNVVHGEVYARRPDGTKHKIFDLISKFNIHATGDNGQTALHDFCESRCFDDGIFRKLLACGADPGARDKFGKTVVQVLISNQSPSALEPSPRSSGLENQE